jgi:valyl-tRNA synthetase
LAEKEIQGLTAGLANPNVAGNAPPAVVAGSRAKLAEAHATLARGWLANLG